MHLNLSNLFHLTSWCPDNNEYRSDIKWLYNDCVEIRINGFCFNDKPCRTGDLDDSSESVSSFVCQYELNFKSKTRIIPSIPSTLQDGFHLHENEYLLSSSKVYKLSLLSDGNLVIYVI